MSAIISDCGRYRYRLERDVQMDGKVFAFFGVNPSTADASLDDATVRKWRGFCKVHGARRFIVGNVFAYRATDVRNVAQAADPIGPENAYRIAQIIAEADILIPCYGDTAKVPDRLRGDFAFLMAKLLRSGKPVLHFGLTKRGDPKHPLMLGYDTPLVPWESSSERGAAP